MRPQEKENQHRQFSPPGIRISDRHKASTWQALWLGQLKLLSITCELHVYEAPMGPTSSVATVTTDRRKAYFADTDALHPCRYAQPSPSSTLGLQRLTGCPMELFAKAVDCGTMGCHPFCTCMQCLASENYLSN